MIKKKSPGRRGVLKKKYNEDDDIDKRIYELKIGIEKELKRREIAAVEQREKDIKEQLEKEAMESKKKNIEDKKQHEKESEKRSFIEQYLKKIDNNYNKLLNKNVEKLKEMEEKKLKESSEKVKEMQKLENEKSKLIKNRISEFNKVKDIYLFESQINKKFGSYCRKNIECESQNCVESKASNGLKIQKIYNNVLKNAIIININNVLNTVDIKYIDKDISGLIEKNVKISDIQMHGKCGAKQFI